MALTFNDSKLQIIKLALSIARKSGLKSEDEQGKSFFSWRKSATKAKMQELEEEIEEHLNNPE